MRRNQIIQSDFYKQPDWKDWYFVPWAGWFYNLIIVNNDEQKAEMLRRRKEVWDFMIEQTEARYYVNRGSFPGFHFESPRDAALYKLKFYL